MNCIKCGKEIAANQVFCEECLEDMQLHPVKPGTPVVLPPREKPAAQKRGPHKRIHKPEEIISNMRKLILWLLAVILALMIGLTITILLLVHKDAPEKTAETLDQSYAVSMEVAADITDA